MCSDVDLASLAPGLCLLKAGAGRLGDLDTYLYCGCPDVARYFDELYGNVASDMDPDGVNPARAVRP